MIKKTVLNILRNLNKRIKPISWKNLRSLHPISDVFGYDRGNQSIHRYYVDEFIKMHADKIKGSVLEVGDNLYTGQYINQVSNSQVIHYAEAKNSRTFIGDLTKIETLPKSHFDCFICTQTFNFIYDFQAAIEGSRYVLKKGGHLIATVSGIQQLSNFDATRWGDYWRFTDQACLKAFSKTFGEGNVEIKTYGNVLTCVAALEGLTSSELTKDELDFLDPGYQLIIGIVAKVS
jgi:hypothetical protein